MKIYVASSWRNQRQKEVVKQLRDAGHSVYDFKNPDGGNDESGGFSWSDVDPEWQNWKPSQHIMALNHPIATKGFNRDFDAMKWADVCVLVTPSGRSAHIEAGWMQGAGKPVIALLDEDNPQEPDLMYGCFSYLRTSISDVIIILTTLDNKEYMSHIESNFKLFRVKDGRQVLVECGSDSESKTPAIIFSFYIPHNDVEVKVTMSNQYPDDQDGFNNRDEDWRSCDLSSMAQNYYDAAIKQFREISS